MPSPRRRSPLERIMFSASNYWFMLVADVAGAALFLGFGARFFAGPAVVAAGAVIGGVVAWGGLEHAVHRWVLHGPPSALQRAHSRHHRDAAALISAPALLSTALAVGAWSLLSVPLAGGTAALAVGGIYCGYNYYALLHHVQHHHPGIVARFPWLMRLDRAHRLHHRLYVVNYGVTTAWWDRLLRSDDRSRQAPSMRVTR